MKIFLIIIAIILYFPVHAQNSGIISGEVIDSQDNSPIFSAVITIIDKQIRKTQAETDPLGKFDIKNINPGKYNVKIST